MTRLLPALAILALAGAAQAEDLSAGISLPASALPAPRNASTAISVNPASKRPKESISLAMCGLEAYGERTDLDAGLIDRNIDDPARAAGGAAAIAKDQGGNARDYRSAIVLGVTLGYHF